MRSATEEAGDEKMELPRRHPAVMLPLASANDVAVFQGRAVNYLDET